MVRKSLALFAIVIPLVLAACGGDDDSDSTSASSDTESSTTVSAGGSGETIDFSETEFKIDPADPTAKAGNVTFNVSNDGQTVHNLEVEGNGVEEVTDDLAARRQGRPQRRSRARHVRDLLLDRQPPRAGHGGRAHRSVAARAESPADGPRTAPVTSPGWSAASAGGTQPPNARSSSIATAIATWSRSRPAAT